MQIFLEKIIPPEVLNVIKQNSRFQKIVGFDWLWLWTYSEPGGIILHRKFLNGLLIGF